MTPQAEMQNHGKTDSMRAVLLLSTSGGMTMLRLLLSLIFVLAPLMAACSQSDEPSQMSKVIDASLENMKRESLPGAALVKKKCSTCHYLDRNITKVGPSLKGIVGRAPSISGVPFSIWDEKSLDHWLEDPTGIKPGTMMAIPGIKSAKDRAAIIEYLKQF